MTEIASKSQLRWAILRATAVIVPLILMLGGLAGNLTGGDQSGWYMTLQKPEWAPAASTFTLVWPLLYLLIGLATAIVWYARGNPLRTAGLVLFGVMLVLTIAWTPVVFGEKDLGTGVIVSCLLLATALATLVVYWRIRVSSGLLMAPFVAWTLLLTLLTFALDGRNPDGGLPQGPQTLQLAPA